MIPTDLKEKFKNGKIFAVLLVRTLNEKDVKSMVTDKLLNILNEN